MKDNERAIADLDIAIKLDPKNAVAYDSRGFAKFEIGDYKGAITNYDRAIELNPKNADDYSFRNICKSEIGDYKGAIADLDKVILSQIVDMFLCPLCDKFFIIYGTHIA